MRAVDRVLEERIDEGYRAFQAKLVPTIDPARILGVRVPEVRRIARALERSGEAGAFLSELPHRTYEEDLLHAILISADPDYVACVALLEAFLPHVDNWAVCDTLSPRSFAAHPADLPERARGWMASSHPYTVRFGIAVLMRFYLGEQFVEHYVHEVAALRSDEYYVNMMRAWYLATALAVQEEATLAVIEGGELDRWTHNKAIQKAIESRRISDERKRMLRGLKRR